MMTPHLLFRKQLKALREAQGWSQARLAAEVVKRGGVITQTTLTRLERGPRQVTLDELLTLAAALRVSPLVLLLPETAEDSVRIDRQELSAADLADWFLGVDPLDKGGWGERAVSRPLVDTIISKVPFAIRVLSEHEVDGSEEQRALLEAAARCDWLIRKHVRPVLKAPSKPAKPAKAKTRG